LERTDLRLAPALPERKGTPVAAALGAAVLAAAALATWNGADAARRPWNAAAIAESALAESLRTGDPAAAREAEDRLRQRLTRTPLDAASRTIAANLMVESAETDALRLAAVEQALAATRLVPTDEWIGRGTARVLARCGRPDLALKETARMFEYAPDDGAATLADIEPFAPAGHLEDGIPATSAAWLAWSIRLRMNGREAEADARLADLLARWPGDLDALRVAASAAASRSRIDELVRLVPPSLVLPDTESAAVLHAFRAWSKAVSGDAAGARADAQAAVSLSREDTWVLTLAGDAEVATDPALAREYWNRALYKLLAAEATRDQARWLRSRLARLDEREGRAGDALRAWRAIIAEHADDAEAKQRIAELTGDASTGRR
jgi:hypothetical protein